MRFKEAQFRKRANIIQDIYNALKKLFVTTRHGTKNIHQYLMDKAHDLWEKHRDWTYRDFVSHLSPLRKDAVLIGNFNYQIENGGFLQWDWNGYSEYSGDIFRILDEFSAYSPEAAKLANEVSSLINKFLHLKDEYSCRGEFYWDLYEINDWENLIYCLYDAGLLNNDPDYYLYPADEEQERDAETEVRDVVESLRNEFEQAVDNLDSRYYKINDRFLDLFNDWLISQI